jgi:uncharacterized protein YbdZ (MbtH family)
VVEVEEEEEGKQYSLWPQKCSGSIENS